MMTASDKGNIDDPPPLSFAGRKKKKTAARNLFSDPWADWRPMWSEKGKTPHDLQERHSPTQTVAVRIPADKQTRKNQRRIVDARLWEAMSASQQQAAIEIALAYETMGRGLGYVISDWKRIPGARGLSNVADAHSRLINAYIDWTKYCHKSGVSHSMIIDVLVFGFSCKALDRERRVRAGTSRENLLAGLSLYSRLKGWPV